MLKWQYNEQKTLNEHWTFLIKRSWWVLCKPRFPFFWWVFLVFVCVLLGMLRSKLRSLLCVVLEYIMFHIQINTEPMRMCKISFHRCHLSPSVYCKAYLMLNNCRDLGPWVIRSAFFPLFVQLHVLFCWTWGYFSIYSTLTFLPLQLTF